MSVSPAFKDADLFQNSALEDGEESDEVVVEIPNECLTEVYVFYLSPIHHWHSSLHPHLLTIVH